MYYSPDDSVETKFQEILSNLIAVDFMGVVEWFLGTHFSWSLTPSTVKVHMNQAGFAANLAERFQVDSKTPSPTITPYRSGIPIDAIADSTNETHSTAQQRRSEAYMSLVGSIGWLAQCTRPDIAPVHSFLSSYNNKPSPGHMKAALHALHYIHSTHDYGITFTSENRHPLHTYLHFPDSSDTEAYLDATPPRSGMESKLTTYSDACWGSQIGNAVREGTLLPLFKLRSMSGAIVFRSGGPIAWASERQDRTSLSSCEAEIRATNVAGKLTLAIRNIANGFCSIGVPISDADGATTIWNDNEACVSWTHNTTSKAIRHMELKENAVREWVQHKLIEVKHVSGKINPADLFTKEMKDSAHFRHLRDSFMSRYSSFRQNALAAHYSHDNTTVSTDSSTITSPPR